MSNAAAAAAPQPPNPIHNPPPFIYKIVPVADWEATFEKTGRYTGSELDKKDGFIHISDRHATARTIELYYANQPHIVLVQLKTAEMLKAGGDKLKWDWVPSRATYFPHWYDLEAGFTKEFISRVDKLTYDEAAKKHILPELQ